MKFLSTLSTLSIGAVTFQIVVAGPVAYGLCQTECNKSAVACYSKSGLTFGTVIANADAPPAALACNAAQGTCAAKCAKDVLKDNKTA